MSTTVYLAVTFDPRELWFQAGYNYEKTQIAQWGHDFDSAAVALDHFLNNDCFNGVELDIKSVLKSDSKVILNLGPKSKESLEATAASENKSLEEWLHKKLGTNDVEIIVYQPK